MNTDDRIRDALHAAAIDPSVDDVEERVARRRAHRRTMRRVQTGVAGAVAVALVSVGFVVLLSDDAERRVAVAPAPGAFPVVRAAPGAPTPDAGSRATVRPVRVTPDEGYLRGPLLEGRGGLAVAAYDRAGATYTYPPSRIVRVATDGDVTDRVDLQGEILSLADGEGARWALTKDKTVVGPTDIEFRVKRIAVDGSVASNEVPRDQQPIGTIVAGGGGVWVPTRTSVLRFDVRTGSLAAVIPMSVTTDRRNVAVTGKAAYVTDGTSLLRLDPSTDQAFRDFTVVDGGVVELVDAAANDFVIWALGSGADGALLDGRAQWDVAQRRRGHHGRAPRRVRGCVDRCARRRRVGRGLARRASLGAAARAGLAGSRGDEHHPAHA